MIRVFGPPFYWESISAEQRAIQMGLKRRYEEVIELLELLWRHAPEALAEEFHEADAQARVWIELGSGNFSLSGQASANERKFRAVASAL